MKVEFFASPSSQLLGVFHEARQSGLPALLLCGSLGHEHLRGHRALRMVAERWQGASFRFDWTGCGDSSGSEIPSVEHLLGDLRSASLRLKSLAPGPQTIVGLRLGALLAAELADSSTANLVGWHAPESGASWLAQIGRIDAEARDFSHVERPPSSNHDLVGWPYSPESLRDISKLHRRPELNIAEALAEDWPLVTHREVTWLPGPSLGQLIRSLSK